MKDQNRRLNSELINFKQNQGNSPNYIDYSVYKEVDPLYSNEKHDGLSKSLLKRNEMKDQYNFNYSLEKNKLSPEKYENYSQDLLLGSKESKDDIISFNNEFSNYQSQIEKMRNEISYLGTKLVDIENNTKYYTQKQNDSEKMKIISPEIPHKSDTGNQNIKDKNFRKQTQINNNRTKQDFSNYSGNNSIKHLQEYPNTKAIDIINKKNVISNENNQINLNDPKNVLLENKILKSQISEIENYLRNLGYSTMDDYEKYFGRQNKSFMRIELEIFKDRAESISEKYEEILEALSEKVRNQKQLFLKKAKEILELRKNQIKEITSKNDLVFQKYNINISKIKKESESFIEKLNLMKNIMSEVL